MSWNFDLRIVISISFRHNSTHYSIPLLASAMWIKSFTFLYLHFSEASIHTIFIDFFLIYCLNLCFLIIYHLVTDIIRKQTSSKSLSRFRICFSCVYVRWKKNYKNIEIYCRNLYVKSRLRNTGLMCVADALWSHPSLLGTHSSDSLLLQAPVAFVWRHSLAIKIFSVCGQGSRQSANNLMPPWVVYKQLMDGVDEWNHTLGGITGKHVAVELGFSDSQWKPAHYAPVLTPFPPLSHMPALPPVLLEKTYIVNCTHILVCFCGKPA